MALDRRLKTSIIIPCYLLPNKNSELLTFTKNCIDSIKEHTKNYELVLVDNASEIGAEYLREQADIYVRFQENLGFAPAVNAGIKVSGGEWLCVMNNDIVVLDGWLDTMRNAWDEETGAVSSHLHDHDPQHKAGREVAHPGLMFGALWLTRRKVVETVGFLDEQFERGMFEDKDYWVRLMKHGYSLIKAGWCHHIGNATWGKLPYQQKIYLANKERFETKWQIKL